MTEVALVPASVRPTGVRRTDSTFLLRSKPSCGPVTTEAHLAPLPAHLAADRLTSVAAVRGGRG